MSKQVWKYPLGPDTTNIPMPLGAQVLTVQPQKVVEGEQPMLWALVNPDAELQPRSFLVMFTGVDFPDSIVIDRYIGTFQMADAPYLLPLVYHVFELVRSANE